MKLYSSTLQVQKLECVISMTFHPETGGQVIILLKEQREESTTLFNLSGKDKSSCDKFEPIKIGQQCWCAAPVFSGDR